MRIQEIILTEDYPAWLILQYILVRVYQADRQIKKVVELLKNIVSIQETILTEDYPSRLVL